MPPLLRHLLAALLLLAAPAAAEPADLPRLLEAAAAHQAAGRFPEARRALDAAAALATETAARGDDAALGLIAGDHALATGHSQVALDVLQAAAETARGTGDRALLARLLNNLGNARSVRGLAAKAESAYGEALALAEALGDRDLAATALVNLARHHARAGNAAALAALLPKAQAGVTALPEGGRKAFALLSLGRAVAAGGSGRSPGSGELRLAAARLFDEARRQAEAADDPRLLSYALGYLGQLYEREGRPVEAQALTARALFHVQQANAPEVAYLWHWQKGRLMLAQGREDEALVAYELAVETLRSIRGDIDNGLRIGSDAFRELVGPVYYGLADVLLRKSAAEKDPERHRALLRRARDTVEMLKGAELRNLFQDECVVELAPKRTDLDTLAERTVVLYPVPLADRLELLLTVPGGMRQVTVPVPAATLDAEVLALRAALENVYSDAYLAHARRVYDWLIRPIEWALAEQAVDTLVVVPDGQLRTIPPAVLHDGRQFLIEKVAVAVTAGLALTDPKTISGRDLRALVSGLSVGGENFEALPGVIDETQSVRKVFDSRVLLDQQFTVDNVVSAFQERPYTVVHIATHGNFDRDPKQTFLLAYDGKITIDKLEEMIGAGRTREEAVELLTLSACQTAVGDDRAALGLAGVAVKAGARSVLASLWPVYDDATVRLMNDFYRRLKEGGVSKAEALRQTQMTFVGDRLNRHPGYWAPFILIGNWL